MGSDIDSGQYLGSESPSEYLAFKIDNEEYGLEISKVQEIRGYENVTGLANVPAHVKGVINLRGIIVPIIDMRVKFGIAAPIYNQFTLVIILNVTQNTTVGIVVDAVSDVIKLSAAQITPPPQGGSRFSTDTHYLLGIGTMEHQMLLLVDIDRLMASAGICLSDQISA